MKKDKLYIFLHMPKTAGSSLANHIIKNLQINEYVHLNISTVFFNLAKKKMDYLLNEKDIRAYFLSLTKEQKDNIKIIFGHSVYYGIHTFFDKDPIYFTFVRDPCKSIISLYNFQKTLISLPDKEFYALKLKPNKEFFKELNDRIKKKKVNAFMSFEAWLTENTGVENYFIYFLKSRKFIEDQKQKIGKNDILKALKKFSFIGITENFDEDALFLYHKLGISKFYGNQNISKKFFTPKNYELFKQEKMENNKLIYEFYNLCLKQNKKFKENNIYFYFVVNYMRIKRMLFYAFNNKNLK